MTFNQYLIKLLQGIAVKTLKKNNNNKLNIAIKKLNNKNTNKYNTKEYSDVFSDTTINLLDSKSSNTFFTSQFQQELKEILCSYSDFKKMSSNVPFYFKKQFEIFKQKCEKYIYQQKNCVQNLVLKLNLYFSNIINFKFYLCYLFM
jgi:hypothetical protein